MHNTPSAHSLLEAARFHQQHTPGKVRMIVPPPGTWKNWDDAIVVEANGQATPMFETTSIQTVLLDSSIPYDTDGCLIVSYLYRDASNYKYYGTHTIAGPIDRIGLAWLITALTAGDDGCFIPSQIGMPDLQPIDSLDFDGDDHVWHELISIGWRSSKGAADTTWNDIRPLAKERALLGYDLMAALASFDHAY